MEGARLKAKPLLEWVARFRAEHNGRAPSKADTPADLMPLWDALKSLRSTKSEVPKAQPSAPTAALAAATMSPPGRGQGKRHPLGPLLPPNDAGSVMASPPPSRGGCGTPRAGGTPHSARLRGTPGSAGLELGPTPEAAVARPTTGKGRAAAVRFLSFDSLASSACASIPSSAEKGQPDSGGIKAEPGADLKRVRVAVPSQLGGAGAANLAAQAAAAAVAAAASLEAMPSPRAIFDARQAGLLSPQHGALKSAAAGTSVAHSPQHMLSPSVVRPGRALASRMQRGDCFAKSAAEQVRCQALPSATKRRPTPPPSPGAPDMTDDAPAWLMGHHALSSLQTDGGGGDGDGARAPSWPTAATACAAPVWTADWASPTGPDDLWPAAPPSLMVSKPAPSTASECQQGAAAASSALPLPPPQTGLHGGGMPAQPSAPTQVVGTGGNEQPQRGDAAAPAAPHLQGAAAAAAVRAPFASSPGVHRAAPGGRGRLAVSPASRQLSAKKRLHLSASPPPAAGRGQPAPPLGGLPGPPAAEQPQQQQQQEEAHLARAPPAEAVPSAAAAAAPPAKKARLAATAAPRRAAAAVAAPRRVASTTAAAAAPKRRGKAAAGAPVVVPATAAAAATGAAGEEGEVHAAASRRSSSRLAAAPRVSYGGRGKGGGSDSEGEESDEYAPKPGEEAEEEDVEAEGGDDEAPTGSGRAPEGGGGMPKARKRGSQRKAGAGAGSKVEGEEGAGGAASGSGRGTDVDRADGGGPAGMDPPPPAAKVKAVRRKSVTAAGGVAKPPRQARKPAAAGATAAAAGIRPIAKAKVARKPAMSKASGAGMLNNAPGPSGRSTSGMMGLHAPAIPGKHGFAGKATSVPGRGGAVGKGSSNQSGHNFVRIQSGARARHSFGYESKSAASGRLKANKTRMRRVNGQMVKVAFKAPHGAGQGAETVEGFRNEQRCFKCGGSGHWARACPHELGTAAQNASDTRPSDHGAAPVFGSAIAPTADNAAAAAPALNLVATGVHAPIIASGPPSSLLAAAAAVARPLPALPKELAGRDPASLTDDELRSALKALFGHDDFRGRQLEILRLVLSGRPVLGILPTGAGKSLCYQLPAALLPGVVLVVSPLLALMRNQLDQLPPSVPGAMLSGEMSGAEVQATLADAAEGRIKLLYVAPEKLLAPAVMNALQRMPQISLVCVDEAHCVAEWGHSFRPAYFRLGYALRAQIRPRAVLALTATATRPTERCVAQVLGMPSDCILRDSPLRDNLGLRVLHDNGATRGDRTQPRLLSLLKAGALKNTASVIVYVTFQSQADEVAAFLTRNGIRANAYHAGKHMNQRLTTQKSFASGSLRVVVATVAFGMGVDNAGVGSVVHLTMPRSLEDYVQQVGRAGRDGTPAQCFLMLDADDYVKMRSLAFSNAVEQQAVRTLLERVFTPTSLAQLTADEVNAAAVAAASRPAAPQVERSVMPWDDPEEQAAAAAAQQGGGGGGGPGASGEEAGGTSGQAGPAGPAAEKPMRSCYGVLPLIDTCTELDIAEETIETVMSYLQGMDGSGFVRMLPVTSVHVDVRFHSTPAEVLAKRYPVIAALLRSRPRVSQGSHRGIMERMIACSGMSSSQIIRQLADVARSQEIHFVTSRPRALAWQVLRPPPEQLPLLAAELHSRLYRQNAVNVRRLDVMYAHGAIASKLPAEEQEDYLNRAMSAYFDEDSERQPMPEGAPDMPVTRSTERVTREVAHFLLNNRQTVVELARPLTGTAVARIFHGLNSVAQPRDQWDKCGFWGKHGTLDFAHVAQVASEQLRQLAIHTQLQAARLARK